MYNLFSNTFIYTFELLYNIRFKNSNAIECLQQLNTIKLYLEEDLAHGESYTKIVPNGEYDEIQYEDDCGYDNYDYQQLLDLYEELNKEIDKINREILTYKNHGKKVFNDTKYYDILEYNYLKQDLEIRTEDTSKTISTLQKEIKQSLSSILIPCDIPNKKISALDRVQAQIVKDNITLKRKT